MAKKKSDKQLGDNRVIPRKEFAKMHEKPAKKKEKTDE